MGTALLVGEFRDASGRLTAKRWSTTLSLQVAVLQRRGEFRGGRFHFASSLLNCRTYRVARIAIGCMVHTSHLVVGPLELIPSNRLPSVRRSLDTWIAALEKSEATSNSTRSWLCCSRQRSWIVGEWIDRGRQR